MIPPLGVDGCLPPGRHEALLEETYQRFVVEAPFRNERETIWEAFVLWARLLWSTFPTAQLWVNGGFVTHKTWAPPSDVDVAALVRASEYNAKMTPTLDRQLWTAMTDDDPPLRVQPMGGYVDGFYAFRGPVDPPYWDRQWRRIKGADGVEVIGQVKGYLEVRAP